MTGVQTCALPIYIVEFNIPTGIPILYELDDQLQSLGWRFLGDPAAIAAAQDAVKRQTEKKKG